MEMLFLVELVAIIKLKKKKKKKNRNHTKEFFRYKWYNFVKLIQPIWRCDDKVIFVFRELQLTQMLLNFKTSFCSLKTRDLGAKLYVAFLLF